MHFDFVFGVPASSFVPDGWRDVIAPEHLGSFVQSFKDAFDARRSFKTELCVLDKNAQRRWFRVESVPRTDDRGTFLGYTGCATDVTDVKLAEQHRELLINELNHRVKNTLATVQSIVSQTLRNTSDAERARADVERRLIALSGAHDVLTRENWESADVHQIVRQALAPFANTAPARFRRHGPHLRVSPELSLALSMALHELATNAIKHGALSNDAGEVNVAWTIDGEAQPARLSLVWSEYGGPAVSFPNRRGFGTRLIERSFAARNGTATLAFEPTGLVCSIQVDVEGAV
jgi:two-component sensor histidine kinase